MTFALGLHIFSAILDEANFYEDKQGNDNAEEVYDMLQRRISSRFSNSIIVAISSSTHDRSFTRRKEEEFNNGAKI